MAKTLWGKVYYQEIYAGILQEEIGGRCVFTYDESYIEARHPAISYTMPLTKNPYKNERGLHPFFDNLVAEGWFQKAQAKTLDINPNHRFALLLGFGHDLAGAVSVIDPEPQKYRSLSHADEALFAASLSRASLSGVQRKLLVVKDGASFRPVKGSELSTHIAKLPSGELNELIELEYLTTKAIKNLLPSDKVADLEIFDIPSLKERALVISRFDRTKSKKRLHFEEFNQLLNRYSKDKYSGSYEEMGQFINNTPGCIPAESERLFQRILASLLIGNTDAHLKNFAMFHTKDGLRLTPSYDLVGSMFYPQYRSIAIEIANIKDLDIGALKSKHLSIMGQKFGFDNDIILDAVKTLENNLPKALSSIESSNVGSKQLRKRLITIMEARWNGGFKSIGKLSLKRQNKEEKS